MDDSGRRRRAARAIGTTVGVLALLHVTFVALTFAGLPGLGGVDVAGLGALTAPAGEEADVGADPVEQTVPEAVTDAPPAPEGASGGDLPSSEDPSSATAAPTTTAAAPATTTTVPPVTTTQPTMTLPSNGQGGAAPSPSSTVPDKGGPPTIHPRDQ